MVENFPPLGNADRKIWGSTVIIPTLDVFGTIRLFEVREGKETTQDSLQHVCLQKKVCMINLCRKNRNHCVHKALIRVSVFLLVFLLLHV